MSEVSWAELHPASDLFTWFHLVETARRVDGDLTWITVAPEAVAESVRIRFAVNGDQHVPAFQLAIDRGWLDGEATAMPNAGDLAKSVVECFSRADPVLRRVADDLQAGAFAASRSPVFTRGEPPFPTGGSDVAALVAVLTTRDSPFAEIRSARAISATNVAATGCLWFVLSWGVAPEAPERW